MKNTTHLLAFVCLLALAQSAAAEPPATKHQLAKLDEPRLADQRTIAVENIPADGKVAIMTPAPNIVRAWIDGQDGAPPQVLRWTFNKDASEIDVLLPQATVADRATIHFLTAEQSSRQASGVIVFSALDAQVVGTKAQLETHPGNHRIGYWVNGNDYVTWQLAAEIPAGSYDIELVYSRAGKSGAAAAVTIGESQLPVKLASTGSWYVYQVQPIGKIELNAADNLHAEVKSTAQIGPVMNLKAILLHPTDR